MFGPTLDRALFQVVSCPSADLQAASTSSLALRLSRGDDLLTAPTAQTTGIGHCMATVKIIIIIVIIIVWAKYWARQTLFGTGSGVCPGLFAHLTDFVQLLSLSNTAWAC